MRALSKSKGDKGEKKIARKAARKELKKELKSLGFEKEEIKSIIKREY